MLADLSQEATYEGMTIVKLAASAPEHAQPSFPRPWSAPRTGDETIARPRPFDESIAKRGSASDEQVKISDVSQFMGRDGYLRDFIAGWDIALPLATGDREADMRPLRRGGLGVELKYRNFSAVMSVSRRIPMVTACNIDGGQSRRLPRPSGWYLDGRLDIADQLGPAFYRANKFDQGHMVPADAIWGASDMDALQALSDTFHYTNACPQLAHMNRGVWRNLEAYVMAEARKNDAKISVFTGPFFGENDVVYRDEKIPPSFWKVIAFVKEDGRPSATAYRLSQELELKTTPFDEADNKLGWANYGDYKTLQISVKQVFDETGIDFRSLFKFDGFTARELAEAHRPHSDAYRLDHLVRFSLAPLELASFGAGAFAISFADISVRGR